MELWEKYYAIAASFSKGLEDGWDIDEIGLVI